MRSIKDEFDRKLIGPLKQAILEAMTPEQRREFDPDSLSPPWHAMVAEDLKKLFGEDGTEV